MSDYSLYLYAVDSKSAPEQAFILEKCLSKWELIGGKPSQDMHEPGNRLMEYINFLGCSPALSSGSVDARIRIHTYPNLTAMGGESIETIRYPGCRHPIPDVDAMVASYDPLLSWQCAQCGNQGTYHEINWRKAFGYSKLFIEISAIFPKEALPADKFLTKLQDCTNLNWSWFYSRSSF